MTVTDAAKGLGVTRKAFSELLNGHSGISPEMALRLSMAFGGSAESWVQQQAMYELAQVRKAAGKEYGENHPQELTQKIEQALVNKKHDNEAAAQAAKAFDTNRQYVSDRNFKKTFTNFTVNASERTQTAKHKRIHTTMMPRVY